MLAGAAGHMWSLHTGFVNPELVGWHKSAEALLIILLGGIGSLAGAVVGAFAFYGLGEVAQLVTERKLLVEGIVILVVVLLLRDGLVGIRLPRLAQRAKVDTGCDGHARAEGPPRWLTRPPSWRRRACRNPSAACGRCATSRSA